MGRAPCCEKVGLNRGPWTKQEDQLLINYINENSHGNWRALPKKAGLLRCGKSCRLRWINYLKPDIKRGNFTTEEQDAIIQLHQQLGNKWSAIASRLPGRTDNEIKNMWNTHLKKRLDTFPEQTKRQRRARKQSRKDCKSKNDDVPEQPEKNNSGVKNNNNDNVDPHEDIILKETNSPSQTSLKMSTSSSCTSSVNDDTLEKFLELDDDFWADVLSGSISNVETAEQVSQVNGIGIEEAQDYQLLPASPVSFHSSAVDGFEYFDPNNTRDDEIEFWCNYLVQSL